LSFFGIMMLGAEMVTYVPPAARIDWVHDLAAGAL
jgi:hypothetical protein